MVMKPKTWVIGDIHGRANALHEVLALANFRDETDRLITLGDIVDGGEDTRGVFDRLVKIKHRIDILGNHEGQPGSGWARDWMTFADNPDNSGWNGNLCLMNVDDTDEYYLSGIQEPSG